MRERLSRAEKWKLKRIKRRIRLAEVRVNRLIMRRMKELSTDEKFIENLEIEMKSLNNKSEINNYIKSLMNSES